MVDIKSVDRSEIALQLKDEHILIAQMSANLFAANPNMSILRCVENAYSLLDETFKQRNKRLEDKLDAEGKRRRGY